MPLAALAELLFPPACWACAGPLSEQALNFCPFCPPAPLAPCCGRCAEPLPSPAPACGNCAGRPLAFGRVLALSRYEGPMREAVRRAKFHGESAAWRWLGEALGRAAAAAGTWDAVVPVPSSPGALRGRGLNPAERLGRAVAGTLGVPLIPALERPGSALPQVGLGRAERLANAAGAFSLREGIRMDGQRLLLVDDVVTTGATADACAARLLSAGAASVDVAALAR